MLIVGMMLTVKIHQDLHARHIIPPIGDIGDAHHALSRLPRQLGSPLVDTIVVDDILGLQAELVGVLEHHRDPLGVGVHIDKIRRMLLHR